MSAIRILLAVLVCMTSLHAENADAIKHKFVGTWKLLSYVREEIPSGIKTETMGPRPSGYLIYTAEGRMMAIFTSTDRHKPAAAAPTPRESEELYKSLVSYTGTYTVQNDKIIHHVDVSWNQAWTGTDQTRSYKFEGNHLILATTLSPDAVDGKMSVRTLVWERVN